MLVWKSAGRLALRIAMYAGFVMATPFSAVSAQDVFEGAGRVAAVDSACAPGSCVCVGELEHDTRLEAIGVESGSFERLDCVVADFDGDGRLDYAVPGGEGFAAVMLDLGDGQLRIFPIDAGGVLEPYPPRDAGGEDGGPAVDHWSLLVRWVGQSHAVFTWNGEGFERILYPAH